MSTSTQPLRERASQSRYFKVLIGFLVLATAAEFVVRGPARYLENPSEWNDFSQNYVASKLWLRGESPASSKNFVALWKEQTYVGLDTADIRTRLAPPLGGLVIMAPVAAFPWKPAKILWLFILLLFFVATVWVLVRVLGRPWKNDASLLFVAACLALAPFHTGIANGNTSILVIGLCALAVWTAMQRHDSSAGILFGIACSIKPQLGAFLVLYYLVRQRWRLFAVAVGCTAGLNLIAGFYLSLSGRLWIHEYLTNAAGFVTSNNIDSFASDNLGRFSLINLQVPFFSIARNSNSANLWAFGVTGAIVCVWFLLVLRNKQHSEVLALAAVSTIALLPVYHRAYDAAILTLPLCWCIKEVAGPLKRFAVCGLLLMTPFLIPGSSYLQRLALHHKLPDSLTESRVWECIIMPHETWALLLLCFVLLCAMSVNQNSAAEPRTIRSEVKGLT